MFLFTIFVFLCGQSVTELLGIKRLNMQHLVIKVVFINLCLLVRPHTEGSPVGQIPELLKLS
jgi:hypothetical protein